MTLKSIYIHIEIAAYKSVPFQKTRLYPSRTRRWAVFQSIWYKYIHPEYLAYQNTFLFQWMCQYPCQTRCREVLQSIWNKHIFMLNFRHMNLFSFQSTCLYPCQTRCREVLQSIWNKNIFILNFRHINLFSFQSTCLSIFPLVVRRISFNLLWRSPLERGNIYWNRDILICQKPKFIPLFVRSIGHLKWIEIFVDRLANLQSMWRKHILI